MPLNIDITSLIGRIIKLEQGLLAAGRKKTQAFLEIAGGTLTGPLFLSRDPKLPSEAATKKYVDEKLSSPSQSIVQQNSSTNHRHIFHETPTGLIDGSNVTFLLASSPSPPQSVIVFHNGLALRYSAEYTVSGRQVRLIIPAPQSGDWLTMHYTL